MPKSKPRSSPRKLVPLEIVEQKILMLRGHRIMLDSDLAAIYGVETRVLNQAVKRNLDRFPKTSCSNWLWRKANSFWLQDHSLWPWKRSKYQNMRHTPLPNMALNDLVIWIKCFCGRHVNYNEALNALITTLLSTDLLWTLRKFWCVEVNIVFCFTLSRHITPAFPAVIEA